MIRIAHIILLLVAPLSLAAQVQLQRVLVRNSGTSGNKQIISIKWYTKELWYPEGVNIYRKEAGSNWIRLNSDPIKKLSAVTEAEISKDPDLAFFVPLVNESRTEDVKGLFLINLLVKSFQSEAFSRFLGIQFEDSTVKTGKFYSYKITRLKGADEFTIGESSVIEAEPESQEEPIREIRFQADTNKVKFNWKPEEQRFYAVNIYRRISDQWQQINDKPIMISRSMDSLGRLHYPTVFFIDDSLDPGLYEYQLAGLDFFGKETKKSDAVTVEIMDLIPPAPPEQLNDSINNLTVILTWINPKSEDISSINIYRSNKSAGPFIKINPASLPGNTLAYKDNVPQAGYYYYYISVTDDKNNESKSEVILTEVHDIIAPARPLGLNAEADTGKINLYWQRNTDGDLSGYLIYRTINKNEKSNFVLLNSNPVKEPIFTDRLPRNARNRFLYKVIAIDSSFNKSQPSDIVSAKMPDIIPPVRPYLKSIDNSGSQMILNWIPNRDEDLKGYHIYRKGNAGKYERINKSLVSGDSNNYTDPEIEAGEIYYYFLVAVDSAGNESEYSDALKAFSNSCKLRSGPTNLHARYRNDKKEIYLTWKQDNPYDAIGFVIYRKESESDQMLPISCKTDTHEFYDKKINTGRTYFYEVRAYDSSGSIMKSETIKISIK